jgi:hypothetical protein
VSREQVLARQPQAIVVTGDASRIAEAQRFWQHQLKISLIAYTATGLNAQARVLSSPQNNGA